MAPDWAPPLFYHLLRLLEKWAVSRPLRHVEPFPRGGGDIARRRTLEKTRLSSGGTNQVVLPPGYRESRTQRDALVPRWVCR